MDFTGTASASFSAAHVIEGHPLCGRMHGHRWRVEVEISGGQDPKTGELVGLPELANAVATFCGELDRENLNDMLIGGQPTCLGVGFSIRERLALTFRNVQRVTVWADDFAATIRA